MKQNWVEKALQREFDFRIFDLICKGPLQKNYEKCKGFPTGHLVVLLLLLLCILYSDKNYNIWTYKNNETNNF